MYRIFRNAIFVTIRKRRILPSLSLSVWNKSSFDRPSKRLRFSMHLGVNLIAIDFFLSTPLLFFSSLTMDTGEREESVIGRDGRRSPYGPLGPRPERLTVLPPRGYLWRVGNKNKYEISLPTDNELYQMVIMCTVDTARYCSIHLYPKSILGVGQPTVIISTMSRDIRIRRDIRRENMRKYRIRRETIIAASIDKTLVEE